MSILPKFIDRLLKPSASIADAEEKETGKSFLRDESGAIAIIFVVTLIPIILMLGAAVDYSRVALARSEAQDALDAATLAAVKQIGKVTDAEIRAMIESYVAANGPSNTSITVNPITIEHNPTSLKVWAKGTTEMTVMKLMNFENSEFSISSKSVTGNKTLEVVLVLDNSGSMDSSAGSTTRIEALKNASDELVDILDEKKQDEDSLSFGVVPFTHLVRLSEGMEDAEWLDQNGVSSIHQNNLPPDSNRFDLFATLTDPSTNAAVEWEGCVEARPHPYDIKDTKPSSSKPDSYFVPYFHPDIREPNNEKYSSYASGNSSSSSTYYNYLNISSGSSGGWGWYWNSYYNNSSSSCSGDDDEFGCYKDQTIKSGYDGPNYLCDMPRLLPLTNTISTVKSKIEEMRAKGATNIHMGTIWGLRLLSRKAPYTEGRPYSDEENIKALIIMTDGNNTYYDNYYHAYGWYDDGRINGSSTVVSEMNTRTVEACEAAKSNDVKVFTIYFGSPSKTTAAMLSDCASQDDYYKSVDNANELSTVFQNIASELSKLRLVE
ncbi:TadE/TadG family type IV pilus assembly protein [uncultured Cohaesibacter sp.]|uniref:TadE/TadG family type IV pilus assembly protein n=1 Tax=uncultured Cohaesibacter sp. TaxID=1002546 RepID=UPI0029314F40|nr:TadE/TadG family type IV pilus assembly protein [uncultured Cohaesibacter sp.]